MYLNLTYCSKACVLILFVLYVGLRLPVRLFSCFVMFVVSLLRLLAVGTQCSVAEPRIKVQDGYLLCILYCCL